MWPVEYQKIGVKCRIWKGYSTSLIKRPLLIMTVKIIFFFNLNLFHLNPTVREVSKQGILEVDDNYGLWQCRILIYYLETISTHTLLSATEGSFFISLVECLLESHTKSWRALVSWEKKWYENFKCTFLWLIWFMCKA